MKQNSINQNQKNLRVELTEIKKELETEETHLRSED